MVKVYTDKEIRGIVADLAVLEAELKALRAVADGSAGGGVRVTMECTDAHTG